MNSCSIANDIAYGVLAPLSAAARNTDLGAAYCNAVNEWQVENWVKKEPRLRGLRDRGAG